MSERREFLLKTLIEIDRFHPVPDNHYIMSPVRSSNLMEWQELCLNDQYRYSLVDCGTATLLFCAQQNGDAFIDTKSRMVRRVACPQCDRPMRPKIYSGGMLNPSEYVCDCGMTVELHED